MDDTLNIDVSSVLNSVKFIDTIINQKVIKSVNNYFNTIGNARQ